MSSIFAAQGGYESAQSFVDGLRPAVAVGAGVVALAGVAALLIPARRTTPADPPGASGTTEPGTPATTEYATAG